MIMLRTTLFLLITVALLAEACRQRADTTTTEPTEAATATSRQPVDAGSFLIIPGKRVGTITATSTEASLMARLGPAVVTHDTIYVAEGETTVGTTLFRGTPDQAEIIWKDTRTFSKPDAILLRPSYQSSGRSGKRSRWALENGLKIGSTLREVETINGRPFQLYGFGWDMGGLVGDWQGGVLQPKGQLSLLSVRFSMDSATANDQKLAEQVMGDRPFASSSPVMQTLNPTVSQVMVRL